MFPRVVSRLRGPQVAAGHHTGITPPSGPPEATTSVGVCALVGYGIPAELELLRQANGGKGGEGEEGEAHRARKAAVMPATGAIATCATTE